MTKLQCLQRTQRGHPKSKTLSLPAQKTQHSTVRFYEPTLVPTAVDTTPPAPLPQAGPSRRVSVTTRSRRLPGSIISCWSHPNVIDSGYDEGDVYSPSPVRPAARPPAAFPRPQLVDSAPLGTGAMFFNNPSFSIAGNFGEASPPEEFEIAAGCGDGGSPSRSLPMRTRLEMMGDVTALCAGLPASRATSPVKGTTVAGAGLPPLPPGARRRCRDDAPSRALKAVSFVIPIEWHDVTSTPCSSPEAVTPPQAGKHASAGGAAPPHEDAMPSTPLGLKSMGFVGSDEGINGIEGATTTPSTGASTGSGRSSSPALERLKTRRAASQRLDVKSASTLGLCCAVASPSSASPAAAATAATTEAPAAAADKVAVQWGNVPSSLMLLSPATARALRMVPRTAAAATTAATATATAGAPVELSRGPAQPATASLVMSKSSDVACGVVMVPMALPAPRRPAPAGVEAFTQTGGLSVAVDACTQTEAALEVSSASLKAPGAPAAAVAAATGAPHAGPAAEAPAGKRNSSPSSASSSSGASSRRSTPPRTSTFNVAACLAAQAAAAAATATPAKSAPRARGPSPDDDVETVMDRAERQIASYFQFRLGRTVLTEAERAMIPHHMWRNWRHLQDVAEMVGAHRKQLGVPLEDFQTPMEDSEWAKWVIPDSP